MIVRENELLALSPDILLTKSRLHLSGNYAVLECPIDEFFAWCKSNDIKGAFYSYDFYEEEDYIVSDELIQENTDGKREYAYCKKWAERYNAEIKGIDFSRPNQLTVAAFAYGMTVAYLETDEWIPEEMKEAEEAFFAFQDEREDEILGMYDYNSDNLTLMDLLTEQLLSDKAFRVCTNKGMRATYLENFLKQSQNKKYLKLCKGGTDYRVKESRMYQLLNQIYNEYRNKCYALKIHVGEELPPHDE